MNKICTSIEQSQKLIELGIDVSTADMYWWATSKRYYMEAMDDGDFNEREGHIPAWSLTALLGIIPDKISIDNESYYLSFDKKSIAFRGPITWDGQKSKSFEMDNLIDAVFEMVCWLKEKEIA